MKQTLDTIFENALKRAGGIPGVVAMVTNKEGIIYEGAFGVRDTDTQQPMTLDSVFAMFSTTKALVGAVAMKLMEDGKLHLDDPVENYVPEIADIEVLEGFSDNGEPHTRKAQVKPTIRMLLLHTAGFGYEFFNEEDRKYREAMNIPTILTSSFASIKSVLLFEPGTDWNYGANIDWVGKVIEAVTTMRLSEAIEHYLFRPLGITDASFTLTDDMLMRRVSIHQRSPEGILQAQPNVVLPMPPAMDMGGHGLYASIGEYMKFLRMMLNDGEGVLTKETVDLMAQNGLNDLQSGGWTTADTNLANAGEFFPGVKKSWSYTFQVNDEAAPTGRPAHQLMWAGLANLYYWIDRENGIAGFFATQIFPYHDPAAYMTYLEFESAVYASLKK